MKNYGFMILGLIVSICACGLSFATDYTVNLTRQTLDESPFGSVCIEQIKHQRYGCELNEALMVATNHPGQPFVVIQPGIWIELVSQKNRLAKVVDREVVIRPVELSEVVVAAAPETVAFR